MQLKSAIGTLADAVSEEIETLKKTVMLELDAKVNHSLMRIDDISSTMQKYEHDNSKTQFEVSTLKDELAVV